jgi:hypothetical protein
MVPLPMFCWRALERVDDSFANVAHSLLLKMSVFGPRALPCVENVAQPRHSVPNPGDT